MKTAHELALMMTTRFGGGTKALKEVREMIEGCGDVIATNPAEAEKAAGVRDLMHEVEAELVDLCSGI